jgi:DNA-directed RNA polymerase I subunit RPA43
MESVDVETNKETDAKEQPSASSPAKDDAAKPVVSPESNDNDNKLSSEAITNEEEEEDASNKNKDDTPEDNKERKEDKDNETEPATEIETAQDEAKQETTEDASNKNKDDTPEDNKERKEDKDNETEPATETETAQDEAKQETTEHEKANKEPPPLPPRPVKRARTAYFIFTDEKRPQVQAQHQGEGVAAVAKVLGHMWGAMSDDEKKGYQESAAKERERVSQELEAWAAAGGKLDIDTKGGPKDPLALDFPVARIRKICKLDPEVRGLSKEALLLVTKCAEMFLQKLGKETVRVAQLQNRRKLLPEDVAQVCAHREQFLFLKDDVKDLLKSIESTASDNKGATTHKTDAARQAAAAGSKPLTSYFGPPK